MSCEICGRNSCTKSFHPIEAQESHDEVTDRVKENIKKQLMQRINLYMFNDVVMYDDVVYIINDVL